MIKNLTVSSEKGIRIDKMAVHKYVGRIKSILQLDVISLEINFITNESIIPVNKKFLRHNYATDIITFNYSLESNNLDGEILISAEAAKENAGRFKTKYETEIRRLIIHGILHLIGYRDKTPAQKNLMRAEEERLLNLISNFERITQ